jgi:asparagine synthase (glutamine-hydrolysing)
MCGITGVVDLNGAPIDPSELLAMTGAIAHRGPDDEGFVLIDPASGRTAAFAGPASPIAIRERLGLLSRAEPDFPVSAALGHRRFSIIDLSPAGHQPFFAHDGSCCVVFNGEIYNYIELRAELARSGVQFATASDTEVLVEAYRAWGEDCFARLNGFWAIALYDLRRRRLLLSRDRVGKKPLFWTRVANRIYFASEIKALLEVPAVSSRRAVDPGVVYSWLAYGLKDLDERTFFRDIHALPAGSIATLDAGFPENVRRFWSLPPGRLSERELPLEDAVREVRRVLEDAIHVRLRADVPVSVELSGGMDSSTIAALAAPSRGGALAAYTVRFADPEWNEEPFARALAERYGLEYRVLDSPTENFWNGIRAFTGLEEEPYHSPNLQTNQVVWTLMRASGTKVSLNGAAGDELFAGYADYFAPAQLELLRQGRVRRFAANARHHTQSTGLVDAVQAPLTRMTRALAQQALPERTVRALTRGHFIRGAPFTRSAKTGVLLSQVLRDDMTRSQMPYWLTSGDRGYMGVPLEVRAPFLDYRVVELAFTLPVSYLVRDGWHKWILRKAAEDLLPAQVVWRRRKLGFPFDMPQFVADSSEVIDLLLRHADNPYVDLTRPEQFRSDWYVLSFLLWYELFMNRNDRLFARIEDAARRQRPSVRYGYVPAFIQRALPQTA